MVIVAENHLFIQRGHKINGDKVEDQRRDVLALSHHQQRGAPAQHDHDEVDDETKVNHAIIGERRLCRPE